MLDVAITHDFAGFSLDACFTAPPGVTALFGVSGSGKTTVINAVAGLLRPQAGRIAAGDRVLFDAASGVHLAPEARRLGYVFQEDRLFPHLTVRANLVFGRNRTPRPLWRVSLAEVIDVLGIAHLLDRYPRHLSGGERQRVAIGRALLTSPEILLMDEPLAALDVARKAEILPYLARMARRFPVPVLYVSHSMDEVIHLADQLVLMEQGRVAAQGSVEGLLCRPDLRAITGRGEAGAVAVVRIAAHDEANGITLVDFAGGRLVISRLDVQVGETARIRIHARDIAIALDQPTRLSTRNVIPVVIERLDPVPEDHQVDVTLNAGGARLWAQISAGSAAELNLAPGMAAWALVKAVTITRQWVAER